MAFRDEFLARTRSITGVQWAILGLLIFVIVQSSRVNSRVESLSRELYVLEGRLNDVESDLASVSDVARTATSDDSGLSYRVDEHDDAIRRLRSQFLDLDARVGLFRR